MPNFLSKFVKAASPTHSRDRSLDRRSLEANNPTNRSRATSLGNDSSRGSPTFNDLPPLPTSTIKSEKIHIPAITKTAPGHNLTTINTTDSGSSQPNVTIVPPSPRATASSFSESDLDEPSDRQPDMIKSGAEKLLDRTTTSASGSQTTQEEDITPTPTPTPTPTTEKSPAQQDHLLQHSSVHNGAAPVKETSAAMAPSTLAPAHEVRRTTSNKSLNKSPKPIVTGLPNSSDSTHDENGQNGTYAMTPIVESPTGVRPPEFPTLSEHTPTFLSVRDNSDAVSLMSTNTNSGKEKKRPWKRSTTKKPTGLASALAASGLAMANPSMSAAQSAQISSPIINSPPQSSKTLNSSTPYLSRSPNQSTNHVKGRSDEMSPKSSRSKRSVSSTSGRRRTSISVQSDNMSDVYGDPRTEYYSGLEELSSDDDRSGSDDDLMDLDEDDIPVTGFAVASNKRTADFHELFPAIPEGDYLIEDYGCALQREILIQGRIYISENHICFHANILGWITDLVIPIYEIISLEKKMTAFVIPNAIQITTRQAKYSFASFLSRDTTFDVIHNIWRSARPTDGLSIGSGRGSLDLPSSVVDDAVQVQKGAKMRKATQCQCGHDSKHYHETAMESVIPGTPDRIHNLMFASGFIKEFMVVNQKLTDIQMADWVPSEAGSNLLTRNMSYIKPLNGSLGPKQTKCEIRDEMVFCNFDEYVSTVTTTRTPEVPSGGVFAVKTRTCIMWASAVSTRIIVTTEVEWSGRSFIKGIIERSAIEGQKSYHSELEKAMREYISQHQSEFIPEGVDPAVLVVETPSPETQGNGTAQVNGTTKPDSTDKQREKERNQRSLQWAYDTFAGAAQVGKQSTMVALELIHDAWDQSSSTTILIFLIVILVMSNIYTLMRMGSREEAGRRKEMKKMEEREKWVQGVVSALWDEISAGKKEAGVIGHSRANSDSTAAPSPLRHVPAPAHGSWENEVAYLNQVLDSVEQRAKAIREKLATYEGKLNGLD